MKRVVLAVLTCCLAVACTAATAGNISDTCLSVTGNNWVASYAWLNPTGYDFAASRHSLDLTTCNSGDAVILSGQVDLSCVTMPTSGEWSNYYAGIVLRDINSKQISINFATDWLGGWHGIAPQPWDRIRLESEAPLNNGPSQYYCTEGGWTDNNPSTQIFPSDRVYDFEMSVDAAAQTIGLRVFGKGNGGGQAPPNSNNSVDYKQWYDLGTWDMSSFSFDYSQTELYAKLIASDLADPCDTSTVNFSNLDITAVPEPGSMLALISGIAGFGLIRRRR